MYIYTKPPAGRVRNRPILDHSGQTFGRLTAVELVERRSDGSHRWRFRCECGNETVTSIKLVKKGHTRSCGCFAREALARRNTTHGLSQAHPREYRAWKDMWARCTRKNSTDWNDYGGRGISVCDEWRAFEAFYSHMGDKPIGWSLDRIDVNGNYEPRNCRWADARTQANNKRSNILLELNGCRQTLQQWARQYGIDRTKLRYRLSRGMSLEDALKPGDLRSGRKNPSP